MNVLSDKAYQQFSDLNPDELNKLNFSVYVVDKRWTYLFVNEFVARNIGERGKNLIRKNMWKEFPELTSDPAFVTLRINTDAGKNTNIISTSPITAQRLAIMGFVLKDCTLFTATILPKKEELLQELRSALQKKS